MRVALLARVSTEEQATEAHHSLGAQLRAMKDRATREGWSIVRTFEAPGESASTRDLNRRPVLKGLVEAARRHEFDLVLFHESSRLARDEELSQWLFNELQANGVRLVEADKEVDYFYSPDGRVHYGIQGVLNAWQSRKHGEQVAKVRREQFELGLHVGDVPFGYERPLKPLPDGSVVRDTSAPLVPVRAEATAIHQAFEDRIAGVGLTETAERWNALGLRPHSKRGNLVFTASSIQTILQNEFYAGYIHRRGERRRGAHEPIVSEELWLRVQERIGRGYAAPRSRSPRALSGIAVCAECQGPLWLTTSGNPRYPHLRRAYYRETSKIRQRPCSKRRTSWRAEAAEAEVAGVIRGMAFDREWCARIDREARRLPQGDAYSAERTELVGSRRRATRAYIAGDLEETEWSRIKTAIDARLAAIPAPLPGGVLFGLERLIEVGRVWDGMAQEEQRAGVRLVFERVELDTANKLIWLKPWPEFDSLFRHRREFVSLVPPERLELPTF